jgi:aminopeptidase N
MRNYSVILFLCLSHASVGFAQPSRTYTRADTLRGSITPQRAWWNVLRYDITIKPDYTNRTTSGSNVITYKVLNGAHPALQLDLQDTLRIDSIMLDDRQPLSFTRDGSVYMVKVPQQKKSFVHHIAVHFSGKPRVAPRAPWDGGWTFTKDSLNRPWMTVTCQGLGASVWYPCKDHQGDEPDNGASLTIIIPDTLVAVANGRLQAKELMGDGTVRYKWAVVHPINNYNIIPYIGKYVNFSETYPGLKGKLDLNYWVLDYNLEKAKAYLPTEVRNMLKAFEHWFGPYPFYKDGYQIIDASHTGMEHQSAVAYGNWYKPGYRGRDGSGTGWGMKWDFIVVHESGHEWFGNNITTKDLADMWVHEGFTNYSETLFVEYMFGKDAANAYNAGIRRGIRNDRTIIPPQYNVNAQGSGDMYPKASNMIHSIRHSLNNDELFRRIMMGLNRDFYHQTVTSAQVEAYISKKAGYNFSKVFDQYLRTTQVPVLEYYFTDQNTKVFYRWTNCVKGFDLPLVLRSKNKMVKIFPAEVWKQTKLAEGEAALFNKTEIEKMYYIKADQQAGNAGKNVTTTSGRKQL